jgi:trehalose 6-phosphate synthase
MSRLVAVSNRINIPGNAASAGGLAVGLLSALRQSGGVWFGWNGKSTDTPAAEPESIEKEGIRYVTIELPAAQFDLYYNGFCNSTLWPLHHYFLGAFRYDADEFEAYLEINRGFASALKPLIQADDTVWIHDYQLIPLASQLRAQGVQARIGYGCCRCTPSWCATCASTTWSASRRPRTWKASIRQSTTCFATRP